MTTTSKETKETKFIVSIKPRADNSMSKHLIGALSFFVSSAMQNETTRAL
jgi:hypothetical protein